MLPRPALVVLLAGLAVAGGAAADGGDPTRAALLAAETAAYARAKPVFDRYCNSCHTRDGVDASRNTLVHFELTAYPFGGQHSDTIGYTIRNVLGLSGKKPTMPDGRPGVVRGDELALIRAWTDAWEAADRGGAHPTSTPLGLKESRQSSGTSWQPESTTEYGWHRRVGDWNLGVHFAFAGGFDKMHSARGDVQLATMNWLMGMARRRVGDGDLTLRAMVSAEPLVMPDDGYPLLLQTGEWSGTSALHDRQHPHDLFMELAARGRMPVTDDVAVELYVAAAGEPAVGPPAFVHRASALADPLAPLGHHWQDSTHLAFGVVTGGVYTRMLKLEGSLFNGREPDEDRLDVELRRLDSQAARLSINPTADTSGQVSWARLASPDAHEPTIHIDRFTASAMWNGECGDQTLAVTAVVGHNKPSSGRSTTAGLVEAVWYVGAAHTLFGRAELMTKTGRDLVLPDDALAQRRFGIGSLSAGYVYDLDTDGPVIPGLGLVYTVDVIGEALEPYYGTRAPWGWMAFLRLRPPEH